MESMRWAASPNEFFSTLFGLFGAVTYFSMAVSILLYVFTSLSVYTIAKRRGIRCYGLAWVPVANLWVLGSLSDQYKYVTVGKVQARRRILPWLSVSVFVLTTVFAALVFARAVGFAFSSSIDESAVLNLIGFAVLGWLVCMGLSITYMVFYFIVLYNVFSSCAPANATVFLVLSIFFSITTPFFLFACRNKDNGMPPRYAEIPQGPAPGSPEF